MTVINVNNPSSNALDLILAISVLALTGATGYSVMDPAPIYDDALAAG